MNANDLANLTDSEINEYNEIKINFLQGPWDRECYIRVNWDGDENYKIAGVHQTTTFKIGETITVDEILELL